MVYNFRQYKDPLKIESKRKKRRDNTLRDPFDFFHRGIEAYHIDFSKAEEDYSDSETEFEGNPIYTATLKTENQGARKGLQVSLYLRDPNRAMYYSGFNEEGYTPVPHKLMDYVLGKGKIKEKVLRDIHLETCSIDDFGEFKKFIEINVYYDQNSHLCSKRDSDYASLWVDIALGKNNLFELINTSWDFYGFDDKDPSNCVIYPHFKDIIESKFMRNDFRPYVHRCFEVFSGTDEKEWHDPNIYAQGYTQSAPQPLETIIESAIRILFSGDEREKLEKQVTEVRLKLRNGWASVPTLNLGNIVIPTPGQNSFENDQFVLNAAPLLIEYLHTLGIMTSEQAEELVARKLTNYIVHKSKFQLSRSKATEIVSQIVPSERREVA